MEDTLTLTELELQRARLIAIVRLVDHTNAVEIASTLCDAGVRFLEVTVERAGGFHSLERVVSAVGGRAIVGAGTVLSAADVIRASTVGARFVVAPDTNRDVVNAAHERGLLALPGALTPSEVSAARSSGARMIKLFPGSLGGVDYLRALRAPFPDLKFVPTGGVTSENAPSWFAAGAVAVAMGSNLVHGSGDLDGIFDRARRAVAATSLERGTTSSENVD